MNGYKGYKKNVNKIRLTSKKQRHQPNYKYRGKLFWRRFDAY